MSGFDQNEFVFILCYRLLILVESGMDRTMLSLQLVMHFIHISYTSWLSIGIESSSLLDTIAIHFYIDRA